MPDIQLGAYTIRSHGTHMAKLHMHDWLILLLLVVIEAGLNVIEPFHRFVGEGMMEDLKYPLQDNTIPIWAVPIIAILLPLAVIIIYYLIRKDVFDLHQAVLGLLFAVLVTAVLTDSIKDAVGRPRPDFFWRCFPNGKGVFDPTTKNVMCTGQKSVIREGHKSFPSGHTSWSFAGLGFLAWYLSGKVRVFDRRGHVAKLCIVFLPLLVAALVGVSRVDDYWHHWEDVFAGGVLGLTVASFCYLQFFPPPYDIDAAEQDTNLSRILYTMARQLPNFIKEYNQCDKRKQGDMFLSIHLITQKFGLNFQQVASEVVLALNKEALKQRNSNTTQQQEMHRISELHIAGAGSGKRNVPNGRGGRNIT